MDHKEFHDSISSYLSGDLPDKEQKILRFIPELSGL